jgi:hypothetical protein
LSTKLRLDITWVVQITVVPASARRRDADIDSLALTAAQAANQRVAPLAQLQRVDHLEHDRVDLGVG